MACIGFLHTADVHVATFDRLATERQLSAMHRVESDWLAGAIESGISAELNSQITAALNELLQSCDVVICTCTSLGSIAADHHDSRVFRVDAPMMQRAAEHKGNVLLAYALDSTRASSQSLLHNAGTPVEHIDLLDCTADWAYFERDDITGFGRAIADRIKRRIAKTRPACVVLAQASMTTAHNFLDDCDLPVYSSPATAMDFAATFASGLSD